MSTTEHPITPPPELVQQWWNGTHGAFYEFEAVTTQAARWGADMELEACVDWLDDTDCEDPQEASLRLRRHRRPKPPSLKEQALAVIENSEICDHLSPEHAAILRRALEALPE